MKTCSRHTHHCYKIHITTTSGDEEFNSFEDFVKWLDIGKDDKLYIKTKYNFQALHPKYKSTQWVKLDMEAKSNILPLRTYKRCFKITFLG